MKITVEKGDIILVHSHGFIRQGIQIFMNILYWLHLDFKPFYKKVANHVGIAIRQDEIMEATKKGTYSSDINFSYGDRKNVTIEVYKFNWTKEQLDKLDYIEKKYTAIPYEFSNFLAWIANIFSLGIFWLGAGPSKSTEKLYCSELAALAIFYMTAPDSSKGIEDDRIHNSMRKFWRKSPYHIETLCRKFGTLKETYIW